MQQWRGLLAAIALAVPTAGLAAPDDWGATFDNGHVVTSGTEKFKGTLP